MVTEESLHGNPVKNLQAWKLVVIAFVVTGIISGILYQQTMAYVIRNAKDDIENMLLQHKGVHHYIQRKAHPALYKFKDEGRVPQEFYSPVLFSSSYMVRNMHAYYNEEREKAGLPKLYYKMAAYNPRNPVNKADKIEERVLKMFNENRDVKEYREIIEIDGKEHLFVAVPFLETKPRCLKCHGERENAPVQLQARYKGEGGFGDTVGNIRAIESLRAPLEGQFTIATMMSVASSGGIIAVFILIFFNRMLRATVRKHTNELNTVNVPLREEIEKRIETDKVLNRQKDEYKNLFEFVPCTITLQDRDYKLIRYNREFADKFNPDPGDYCYSAYKRRKEKCENCPVEKTFEDGLTHISEETGVNKDGESAHWIVHTSPIKNDKGEIVAAMEMNVDITERKRAEEALRESEGRFSGFAKASGYGFAMGELSGQLIFGNPAILRIVEEELEADFIDKTFYHYYSDKDKETLKTKILPIVMEKGLWVGEIPLLTAKGNLRPTEQNIFLIADKHGDPQMVGNIITDITERKRVEDELHQYQQHLEKLVKERTSALEAKNQELEIFTYSVSHDLKAPLRGIDGYSRLLVEDYADKLDEEGILFLQNVRQSTAQMNQLIEDLLSYSRMERKTIQLVPVDLNSIIDVLVLEREHEIETRQISMSVKLPFTTVVSDIETMRQVLGNYLDNAIKFLKKDIPGTVEVGGEENEDSWIVWVKDKGIGFDPQYHDRIFDIFQRLHRIEEFPGTGVGLAIVRKAVERIGGRVRADSELGEGSTFFITIPKNDRSK